MAVGEYALYCGQITDDDEPFEENPGGYVGVGTNSLATVNLRVAPDNLPGKVILSANVDDTRIRHWRNADRTGEVVLPKEWANAGAVPSVLYVEGVANSIAARDIALTLTYDENPPVQNNPLFKCEDKVQLTFVKVEVANIKFNHDTTSSASDAINIRQDYNTPYDITNGEWIKGITP